MRIDLVASQPHYRDHMLPIFEALPEHLQGRIHPVHTPVNRPIAGHLAMVAGYVDVRALSGRARMIFVEHGAGQSYGGDEKAGWQPAYSGSGGRFHRGVIGFICPSETVASRWMSAPAVAVGCPKMDRFWKPVTERSVCIAWHWNARICPESRTALPHYQDRLPEIVSAFRDQGFTVYAHHHPRWGTMLDKLYAKAGFDEILPSDTDVFDRAAMLVMDNSSLMYEFASLDRPVVVLNAPWYRRNIDHGLRFWSHVPGMQIDTPEDLISLDLNSVLDHDLHRLARHDAVEHTYAFTDGSSSTRAAGWITQLVEGM
jgi:hypothetical protein